MGLKRRRFPAEFKAKVALAAIRGETPRRIVCQNARNSIPWSLDREADFQARAARQFGKPVFGQHALDRANRNLDAVLGKQLGDLAGRKPLLAPRPNGELTTTIGPLRARIDNLLSLR